MGKQINFFIVRDDERELLETVIQQGDNIIGEKGELLTIEQILQDKDIPIYKCYFVTLNSNIVKDKNGFISELYSDVIEYLRSTINNKQVERGRIYVQLSYYDEHYNQVTKPDWLAKKYNFYSNWVKRNTYKDAGKPPHFYIGKETYELYKQGYQMMSSPKLAIDFEA